MRYFLLPLVLAVSACAGRTHINVPSAEPVVVAQPVAVAVDSPCVPDTLGPPPSYVDTREKLVAAADPAERMQLLYAGRAQREARLNEVEPVIEGCPRGNVEKK